LARLSHFSFNLDERKILIRLGYKKRSGNPPEAVRRALSAEMVAARAMLNPAAVFEVIDYAHTNGHPIFSQAVKVGLAVCTIGPRLERECSACFQRNDLLRGMFLDAIGSEAVIQVCRQTELALVKRARALGLWPSKWFAPGYKGWGLEEQVFIFSRVPAGKIGVRLLDSFLMVPRKSGSFRINFYADRALSTRSF
jgi:hypothetical protein